MHVKTATAVGAGLHGAALLEPRDKRMAAAVAGKQAAQSGSSRRVVTVHLPVHVPSTVFDLGEWHLHGQFPTGFLTPSLSTSTVGG